MPWNNNTGGGGWKGGGGGPWGSGPQQRGPQPPDLEELLRRSQDRLRSALPGGGRGNAAVLAIGANLGLEVVAEGIERGSQWRTLRDLGCHLGQGYLFSRPVDADVALELLTSTGTLGAPRPSEGPLLRAV